MVASRASTQAESAPSSSQTEESSPKQIQSRTVAGFTEATVTPPTNRSRLQER